MIEFRKFSDFPRGTMYDILQDAYSFDARNKQRQSTPPEEIRKGSDVIRRFMRRRFFPDDASMRGSAISASPRTGLPLPA